MTKKNILKIINSEEIIYLLDKAKDLNDCINAKSYSIEEEKVAKQKLDKMLNEIKELV